MRCLNLNICGGSGSQLSIFFAVYINILGFSLDSQKERTKCQMDYLESIKQLEEKWIVNQQNQHKNRFSNGTCDTEV